MSNGWALSHIIVSVLCIGISQSIYYTQYINKNVYLFLTLGSCPETTAGCALDKGMHILNIFESFSMRKKFMIIITLLSHMEL